MKNIEAFIEEHELRADVDWAADNPNMDDSREMNHWLVTIRNPAGAMQVPFSTGLALDHPDLADVLDCLASDAASVRNARSFDDWADEMGFFPMESSEDFRRAERTYQAIEDQSEALEHLIGTEALEELMFETERR